MSKPIRKPGDALDRFPEGEKRHADFAVQLRKLDPEEATLHRGKDDDGKGLYEIAISSEAEIERWFGIEVLGHDKDEVDMSRLVRGAAVLIDHHGDQVGVVESARVDKDKVLRGFIRFSSSQRGQEVERDVLDVIRTSISVGYFIKAAKLVETRKTGDDGPSVDVWRVTRWQPAEVSLVSVPADVSVGVGRSAGVHPGSQGGKPVAEERTMKKVRNEKGEIVEVNDDDPRAAVPDKIEAQPDKRAAEVVRMCSAHQIAPEKMAEFLDRGLSVEQVAMEILALKRTAGATQPAAETIAERIPKKDRERFRYVRAIRIGAGLHPRAHEGGDDFTRGVKFDGIEAEVHQELLKSHEPGRYRGGILVPVDLRTEEERWREWERRQLEHRTLDSKTLTKGPEVVFERPGEFIELLRARAVVMQLGARMLSGLQGPIAFPKQTGGLTVYWVGENPAADVTSSDVALALVNMAPKSLQGTTDYTRQLLAQSSIDVEGMIREEFAIAHALGLDRSAIHGLGAAGEPTGIYKAPDVNVRAVGGNPDYADVIVAETEVATDNADLGALGWLTTPRVAGFLMQTLDFAAASAGRAIWQGTFREGTMGGYRAMATNQVSGTMLGSESTGGTEQGGIFGNWNDLIFGSWGAMELIVDPFAKKKRGIIEVTSFMMADMILRHGESFCKWTGATAP